MQKFTDLELQKIRNVPLEHVFTSLGFSLIKQGSSLKMLCPFHKEGTPSFSINQKTNLCKCFGCDFGGDAIKFVMEYKKIDFQEAVAELLPLVGFSAPAGQRKTQTGLPEHGKSVAGILPETTPVIKKESTDIKEIKYQRILKQTLDYAVRVFKSNLEYQNYLVANRGLNNAELLNEFQIGFVENSFLSRLPTGKEGHEIKQLLKDIGFITESGRLLFDGCLVFPFYDESANIVEIYGRRLKENGSTKLTSRYPNHLYLPGPHGGIFNLKALQASKEIILCESVIDALSFWVHGFRNVTCSFGINGFTEELKQAFINYKIEKVYIAFDNDEVQPNKDTSPAEEKAKEIASFLASGSRPSGSGRLSQGLNFEQKFRPENGIEAFRVIFPTGLDANEYINRVKNPAKDLELLLQGAKKIETEIKIKDLSTLNFTLGTPKSDDLAWEKKSNYNASSSYVFTLGDRVYTIYDLEKNLSKSVLKIRIKLSYNEQFFSDSQIDLFIAKQRKAFIKNASDELQLDAEIINKDIKKILLVLEELQDELIDKELNKNVRKKLELETSAILEAENYGKQPDFVRKLIMADIEKCGLVGENINSLVGYIAASSRKDDKPLGVIIQSSSGAGKSTLMDAVLDMMPEEDVVKFSALTSQSLYYMGSLKNKVLAIVEEEGAEKVTYSLKLLQSEGKISIASTMKNIETGKLGTEEYVVEGPVVIMMCTTNWNIDEELENRCIILTVNETREQTKKIHELQRRRQSLEGLFMKDNAEKVRKLHKNFQRILRPIHIYNPYADHLSFVDFHHRTRRDHEKYLTLIRTITFLNQFQREIKTETRNNVTKEYIETSKDDILLGNELAAQILGTTLDELPGPTRSFILRLDEWVSKKCIEKKIDREDFLFSRRDLREALGLSHTQVKVHLDRLEEMEYVYCDFTKTKRGQKRLYTLSYDGQGLDGSAFYLGLITSEKLMQIDSKINRRKVS